uniref:Uncharacterized protein n=1 Tax=Knipowitschia caucasica TaxID=637954 RepID=A0AAV2J0N9_KNICA
MAQHVHLPPCHHHVSTGPTSASPDPPCHRPSGNQTSPPPLYRLTSPSTEALLRDRPPSPSAFLLVWGVWFTLCRGHRTQENQPCSRLGRRMLVNSFKAFKLNKI